MLSLLVANQPWRLTKALSSLGAVEFLRTRMSLFNMLTQSPRPTETLPTLEALGSLGAITI